MNSFITSIPYFLTTVKYTMLSLLTSTVLLLNTILMRYLYECRKPVTQTLRSIVSLLSIVTLGGHFSATGYFVEKVSERWANPMPTIIFGFILPYNLNSD